MLTIQKANTRALDFYTTKCKYTMDEISPAKVPPSAHPTAHPPSPLGRFRRWCAGFRV